MVTARAAIAQSPAASSGPSVPGAELTVYVMTMGPGDLVWERFGHNALWIHDGRGTDIAYNYGLFDFMQENFILRFIQGEMLYWMEGVDADRTVEFYARSNRTVWVQELNLTPAERDELRDFLEWNALLENRYYRYHYYYDNCSTRVRDVIDRVLGGRIAAQTASVPSGATFRSHTRRLTSNDPSVYTGLMLGLGQPVDRPISLWEEMFLPLKMRQTLNSLTVVDSAGVEQPLVLSEQVLYRSTDGPLPTEPPNWLAWYLLAGALVGGSIALLARGSTHSRAARGAFLSLSVIWSLFAGTGGLILIDLWAFTDHTTSYRNENIFQLNPLSLALIVLLPAMVYGWRRVTMPVRWTAYGAAAIATVGLLIQLLPGVDQVNGGVIAMALPIHLAIAWSVHELTKTRALKS